MARTTPQPKHQAGRRPLSTNFDRLKTYLSTPSSKSGSTQTPTTANIGSSCNLATSSHSINHNKLPTITPTNSSTSKMVGFAKFDSAALVGAALQGTVQLTPVTNEDASPKPSTAKSGKSDKVPSDKATKAQKRRHDSIDSGGGSAPSTPAPKQNSRTSSNSKKTAKKTPDAKVTSTRSKKIKGMPLPSTFEEAGVADRTMFQMKNEGYGWEEIRQKWAEITGNLPGESTLSVRYLKLQQNMTSNGGEDDLRLIRYKREVEIKQNEELWGRVAARVKDEGGHHYAPEVLRKRYETLEKNGFKIGTAGALVLSGTKVDAAPGKESPESTAAVDDFGLDMHMPELGNYFPVLVEGDSGDEDDMFFQERSRKTISDPVPQNVPGSVEEIADHQLDPAAATTAAAAAATEVGVEPSSEATMFQFEAMETIEKMLPESSSKPEMVAGALQSLVNYGSDEE